MTRTTGFFALLLALAACANPAKHQSSGFSGLGSEPGTVTRASLGDPRLATGQLDPDIPAKTVRSGSQNRAAQAELAIRTAGSWRARAVEVGSQELALSVIYVNQTPYAVLKPRSGVFAPGIVPETAASLSASAADLTGCPAGSQVYSHGPQPNRPQGLAVVLACAPD